LFSTHNFLKVPFQDDPLGDLAAIFIPDPCYYAADGLDAAIEKVTVAQLTVGRNEIPDIRLEPGFLRACGAPGKKNLKIFRSKFGSTSAFSSALLACTRASGFA
jgi:hypothetical protein